MRANPPALDVDAVTIELRHRLDTHRATVAAGIATPAATPSLTQHDDGMITDRAGRVLVAAQTSH